MLPPLSILRAALAGLALAPLLQAAPQGFLRQFDSAGDPDFPTVVRELANGDLLYAGKADGLDFTTWPCAFARLDPQGFPINAATYQTLSDPDGILFIADARALPGGGYLACGQTRAANHSNRTRWVGEFDEDGRPEWTWRMAEGGGGTDESCFTGLRLTTDGGCIAFGWQTTDEDDFKSNLARFDADGNLLWGSLLGSSGLLDSTSGSDVVELNDGRFLCVGWSFNGVFAMAVDASGSLLWKKRLQGPTPDFSSTYFRPRLDKTTNGQVVIAAGWGRDTTMTDTGWATNNFPGNDCLVIRLDPDGQVVWSNRYGGLSGDIFSDFAVDVAATPDDGCVVLSESVTFGGADSDLRLIKLDAAGEIEWQRLYGTPGDEQAIGLDRAANGDLLIAARRRVGSSWDGLLLRTDPQGRIAGCEALNTWGHKQAVPLTEQALLEEYGTLIHGTGPVTATPTAGSLSTQSPCLFPGVGTNYCASSPNSTGAAARMQAVGSVSVAANDLILVSSPVPDQVGVFFYGANQVAVPFGNGTRCVGGDAAGIGRLPIEFGQVGVLVHELDLTVASSVELQIQAGDTWNFSCWFRDPAAGGAFFDLSDGLTVTFVP